ncbi:uncharacterized protein LOC129610397 [Condylostylus longicornis]|uniref:uncharacterized protein LOC129610397 n=1 Tax=Condylostylus longicornis TaxID=2530218 RepID=UPI00244E0161|nr:uncharacterized protein LOC129610397 [Condylostylus longicornis]
MRNSLLILIIINFTLLFCLPIEETNDCKSNIPELDEFITGGHEAVPNSLPYQVALSLRKYNGISTLCGGSLISNQFILTAAHCLNNTRLLYASLGAHDLRLESLRIQIENKYFKIHPNFDPILFKNDVALVKLPEPVDFNEKIQPIKLPQNDKENFERTGISAVASGWGKYSDDCKFTSYVLRYVELEVLNRQSCLEFYNTTVLKAENLCTNGSNGKSTCVGDSGGPLIAFNSKNEKIQIGISSFGSQEGCEKGFPAVFTKITSYLNWINENIQDYKMRGNRMRLHQIFSGFPMTFKWWVKEKEISRKVPVRGFKRDTEEKPICNHKRPRKRKTPHNKLMGRAIIDWHYVKPMRIMSRPYSYYSNSDKSYFQPLTMDITKNINENHYNGGRSLGFEHVHRKHGAVKRIFGGNIALHNSFPYQVGLLLRGPRGLNWCGGSLISEDYVVTAAHCIDMAQKTLVFLGSYEIKNPNEAGAKRIEVLSSHFIVHPGWNPRRLIHDIGLIRFPQPIVFTDSIQPIKLPNRNKITSYEGQIGVASGWGRFQTSSPTISYFLRYVELPIISQASCLSNYPFLLQPSNICTSGANGKSTCTGDSGGPLTVEEDGKKILIGITSFGSVFGCEKGFPGVYTRITSYLDWISDITGIGYDTKTKSEESEEEISIENESGGGDIDFGLSA